MTLLHKSGTHYFMSEQLTDKFVRSYWENTPVATPLGTADYLLRKLQSHSYSCTFSKEEIRYDPARWGAYFLFIPKGALIDLDFDGLFIVDILESVEPSAWVQNDEFVSLLCQGLIKYAARL